ncbi:MAG: GNAT family N-acetyltransferase [Candidatus Berkelbacteria bacterium]|nr:GNAT family N-acetyltransferase [Candidatus Berkelbacteria bacterium]
MIIRNVNKGDLSKLGEIYASSFNAANPDENWDATSAKKYLEDRFKKQPNIFILAEDDKNIVGGFVGSIEPCWMGNNLYETDLFVDNRHQRQNIEKNYLLKYSK